MSIIQRIIMMAVSNPGRRALSLSAFAFPCLMEQRPVQEGEPPEPETDGEPPLFLMPPPPTPEGMKRINPRVRIKAKETAEVGCDPMEPRKCSKPCNHGLWEDTNVLGCHFEGKCTLFLGRLSGGVLSSGGKTSYFSSSDSSLPARWG